MKKILFYFLLLSVTSCTWEEPSFNPLFDMVLVEGGTFDMGRRANDMIVDSQKRDDEVPVHSVTLGSFYLSKYEVTVKQYRDFCTVTGRTAPANQKDENPVVGVTWNDAVAYCNWLSQETGQTFRLPTEAEWEFAARGGNKSQGFIFSGSNNLTDVGWYDANTGRSLQRGGQKRANELGLYDMSGSVWEWCRDWYGPYSKEAVTNPKGPSSPSTGAVHVHRGGSYLFGSIYCRITYRGGPIFSGIPNVETFTNSTIGFRLAADIE